MIRYLVRWRARHFLLAASTAGVLVAAPAHSSGEIGKGRVSGLPLPRFASLKTDRVNLREGPSKDHRTAWVFQRLGLPIEIVAEFETWRRIRDAEGTEGWVLHSLLSGRRTGMVMRPTTGDPQTVPLYQRAAAPGDVIARLQPGVITNVKECGDGWCHVVVAHTEKGAFDGYIRQDRLWGVYPDEKIE